MLYFRGTFFLEKPIKFDVSVYVCSNNGNIESRSISVDCSAVVSVQISRN